MQHSIPMVYMSVENTIKRKLYRAVALIKPNIPTFSIYDLSLENNPNSNDSMTETKPNPVAHFSHTDR
jgi:hypothetical protein